MGFLSSILSGMVSPLTGQNNGGFVAQGGQNLQQPFTGDQITGAQGQVQGGLTQQQQLVNALAAQNGIQNQGNVYNQLQNVAQAQGFNPAQSMLNQATGQNVANQAALAAGQRGGSANAGLMARQAGLLGGNAQQQAIGQGATLQAQQALGALGQAGNIAGQQVGNQMGALQGYNAALQGNQGQLIGGLTAQNQNNVANAAQQNAANVQMSMSNAKAQADALGGLLNGIGLGSFVGGQGTKAQGAQAPSTSTAKAFGGEIEGQGNSLSNYMMPSYLHDIASIYHGSENSQPAMLYGGLVPGQAKQAGDHYSNDTVHAKLSPGEVVIPKSVMESEDPVKGAAQFVAALQKKNAASGGGMEGDFKQALASAIKNRRGKK